MQNINARFHVVDISYYINDIALLKLNSRVRLTDNVNVVCLPDTPLTFVPNTTCEVIGWGKTLSGEIALLVKDHVGSETPIVWCRLDIGLASQNNLK